MKLTIIVVEDDFVIALDIRGILEEAGFSVITNIVSVEQAILCVEENKPDLVLIDINLKKDKDGVNLGHYLLKKGGIPYIYISSYSDNFTLERVKETRPFGFIVKPFKKADVTTTVSLVLNQFELNTRAISQSNTTANNEIPYILKDSVDYIMDHINDKINIYDLSLRSRWKHQHFIRVFTNYIGETPYQFILLKKIDKAKKLICETNISISEISFELGFQSYGNFCNAFKKITGKTPNVYRKFYSKTVFSH